MSNSIELKDINAFVRVVRAGSLTRVAKETNTPKATLSHSLRRLEDALGVELFVRSARGMTLTNAGKVYLDNCRRIFDSLESAASAAQRAHSSVGGKIRIAASAEFGTSIVGAATLYLARQHESLKFEVRMYSSDALIADQLEFDCLIYVGTPPDSSFLCRKMGAVSYGIYASPQFVTKYGLPANGAGIESLPGVEYSRNGIPEHWKVYAKDQETTIEYIRRFSVHDYWMAKYYAVAGVALAYLPDFFVHYEVRQGALVQVLPKHRSEEIAAYVIYPHSRLNNPRVKLVVETLCEKFGEFIIHPGYSLIPQPGIPGSRKRK